KRSNGMYTVLRQTIRKRLQTKLNEVKAELRRRMHEPIPKQGKWLQAVVRGHLRYYGVPMNNPALALFRFQVGRLWHRSLSRRSQDRKSTRLNSSHVSISYAVFCLKKKNAGDYSRRRSHRVL